MDDNCVLDFSNHRLTCSMNPETAVTCSKGHSFSQIVLAVYSQSVMPLAYVYAVAASLHVGAFLECVVDTVPTHTAVPMAENTHRVSLGEKGN